MTRITIPEADWASNLADTISAAPRDAVIVVPSEPMQKLGRRTAARMWRDDIKFEVTTL